MIPINEKIHWSVIERLGRAAIVDEKISKSYAPSNLPMQCQGKTWPAEDRVAAENDPRVAQKTPQEEALIDACRDPKLNPRYQKCALFCNLDAEHLGKTSPGARRACARNFLPAPAAHVASWRCAGFGEWTKSRTAKRRQNGNSTPLRSIGPQAHIIPLARDTLARSYFWPVHTFGQFILLARVK